jgi:hypothetical protein
VSKAGILDELENNAEEESFCAVSKVLEMDAKSLG